MTFSLTWLPKVLKAADLKLSLCDGWETRGRGEIGEVLGVMCHHTGTPNAAKKNMPTLNTLIRGAKLPDGSFLEGPLSQLGLARDGTFYVIAAGRANHAGKGEWQGLKNGNTNFIGIEAENAGTTADFPWPEVQMDAYRRGVAAILRHIGKNANFCCGHKEYRRPIGRKNDPSFDMNVFRTGVTAILNGTAKPPVEPSGANRITLRRGMRDPLVIEIQRKLKVDPQSENFDPMTEAVVRAFQLGLNQVPDGIVGPKTWKELDQLV